MRGARWLEDEQPETRSARQHEYAHAQIEWSAHLVMVKPKPLEMVMMMEVAGIAPKNDPCKVRLVRNTEKQHIELTVLTSTIRCKRKKKLNKNIPMSKKTTKDRPSSAVMPFSHSCIDLTTDADGGAAADCDA